ncbi:MAG: glycosyltransferase family 4 protein, partial [Promethearchaeota archaeon]
EIIKLNLSSNVKMLGIRQEIEKFLAISDLLVLTSHYEGFPTVFLEAIASKVPCISTDVGEVKEILDNESIVPIGDIEKIASKIQKFYNNESLRNQVLMKSMNKIKNYDWENVAQSIKKIYINAVRKNRIKF